MKLKSNKQYEEKKKMKDFFSLLDCCNKKNINETTVSAIDSKETANYKLDMKQQFQQLIQKKQQIIN